MKRILIFLSVILIIGVSSASAQQMERGSSIVNVGVGFVPGIGSTVTYDYGLIDSWGPGLFTIGGVVGFNTWSHGSQMGRGSYRETRWAFSPRATYRYSFFPQFEAYATFMLGVGYHNYSEYYDNGLYVFVGATAGCRYSFTQNFSVFAEMGYITSFMNVGVSFNF